MVESQSEAAMIERLNTNYIETFTGKRFWPLNPIVEDIDIFDIAHALAHKCRYTGHTSEFYSVAQHCVLMSQNVPTKHRMEALLHDAVEAYLPDLAYPLRGYFNGFADAEENMHKAIAKRFGLTFPWPDEIKAADRMISKDEAWYLMKTQGKDWPGSTDRLGIRVEAWGPVEANRRFMEQYDILVNWFGDIPDPYHFKRLTHLHSKKRLGK